jgi:hypothetical protein
MSELPPGFFDVGGKLYARCQHCGSLVRVKPLFGTLHICLTDAEIAERHRGAVHDFPQQAQK